MNLGLPLHREVKLSPRYLAFVSLLVPASLLIPFPAFAELPLPPFPDCGNNNSVDQCPPDISHNDFTLNGDSWTYLNYIPDEVRNKVRPQEIALGSGMSTTTAWRTTTGNFSVTIAVLDCGIRWRQGSIANKVSLNVGELPYPLTGGGTSCGRYDCDSNGLVNVQDYADDSRVSIAMGSDDADGLLDASDLLAAFSDGSDDDGNGYIDDIAGWDFMWNDEDAWATTDYYHMTYVLEDAAAEGGETDSAIGHCPNCSILPVRVADSFVGEGNKIAQGIVYAVDMGANVIGMALGSLSNPDVLQEAMQYAWDRNVTIVAAAGDELGYHHNYPGANDHAIYVHSIHYFPIAEWDSARSYLGFYGCNNYGVRMDAVAPSGGCATGSVANTIGAAGLVYSQAENLGLALSASEARQLILRNVDDIDVQESQQDSSPYFPSNEGWDLFFGYGRVNAGKAVEAVSAETIPPEIMFDKPEWFTYVDPRKQSSIIISGEVAARRATSYSYTVEWGPGTDPSDDDYQTVVFRPGLSSPQTGTLATLDLNTVDPTILDAKAPVEVLSGDDTVQEKSDKVNARAITFRITVTDDRGNRAEERKQVFLIEDSDLLTGFPVNLGYSGESSPTLYDLDGNGVLDVIIGSGSGIVHAFRGDGTELSGWPVHVELLPGLDPTNQANHLFADAYSSGGVTDEARAGIIGSPAVGDLDGDGKAEVVVPTLEGALFVFNPNGTVKSGFPVYRDPVADADTNSHMTLDPGMFSSPVLFDLDNDGQLEIIQASMDMKVYVWRADGSRQSGFPVVAENPDGSTGVTTIAGRIVSSPAVGDLDGNGEYEIVVGSNEYQEESTWIGYVYAFSGEGNEHRGGPQVPGWPVEVRGLLSSVITYIGEGISPSPSLADIDADGTLEVLISGVGSRPVLLRYDGNQVRELGCGSSDFGTGNNSQERLFWAVVGNTAFSDFDSDGDPEAMMGGSGMDYFLGMGLSQYMNWDHLATVWNTRTGKMLPNFPRVTEDLSLLSGVASADISGDGSPEMVIGTSGYVLHAFQLDGSQPTGWPKFAGGWLIATPAIGDISGDGKNDVVAVTREGYLLAWKTMGAGGNEWTSFRHDPQNTGNYSMVGEYRARDIGASVGKSSSAAAPSDAEGTISFGGSCSVAPAAGSRGTGMSWLVVVVAGWVVGTRTRGKRRQGL